jgi:hypothetical protein
MSIVDTLNRIDRLVADKASTPVIRSVLFPLRKRIEALETKHARLQKGYAKLEKTFFESEDQAIEKTRELESEHALAINKLKVDSAKKIAELQKSHAEEISALKKSQSQTIAALKKKNRELEHQLFLYRKGSGRGLYNPLHL